MNRNLSSFFLLVVLASIFSCSNNKVKISGSFYGRGNSLLLLEEVSPYRKIIDSTRIASNGSFKFKYKINDKDPQFLNLRLENSFISLLVEGGENIKISSIYNIGGNYTVTGSKGSELIQELNSSMSITAKKIDSLYNIFNSLEDVNKRNEVNREISSIYIKQKQKNIAFIVNNTNSLVSVMALYQKMPNGVVIFGNPTDFIYFKTVADSLTKRYPKSIHVKALKKDVESFQNRSNIENLLNNNVANITVAVPEIKMKDIQQNEQRLSSLMGKVILLSFWSSQTQNSSLFNTELKQIYDAYNDTGFEIYQVSTDTDKAQWVNAVTQQKLPWINVCDFKGLDSRYVKSYNISTVPSNYLIDRNGNIVGKNLFGTDLINGIKKSL